MSPTQLVPGKRTALITGATGFIGSALAQRMRAGGWCIFEVTRDRGFDLSTPGWTSRLPGGRVDAVIHLAQSSRYRSFPEGAPDLFAVNVHATFELLEWSRQNDAGRFILASTGNVYAGRTDRRLQEADRCAPTSMYAASKLAAEHVSVPYGAFFPIHMARIFGVYGPGQDDKLIPRLARRVADGETVTLADGEGGWLTPLHIDDCTAALAVLAGLRPDGEGATPINLAGDEAVSLSQIVHQLGQILGVTPVTEITGGTPFRLCGDNALMKHYYRPSVDLASGLRSMLSSTSLSKIH